jgi:hypothetical protein
MKTTTTISNTTHLDSDLDSDSDLDLDSETKDLKKIQYMKTTKINDDGFMETKIVTICFSEELMMKQHQIPDATTTSNDGMLDSWKRVEEVARSA